MSKKETYRSSVPCIVAIDEGTSSSRAVIVSSNGRFLASHQLEHKQHYPTPGQVEQDVLEIWKNVKICLSKVIEAMKDQEIDIIGIGITNQRETTVIWDKETGIPYYRAITWNDTRTDEICSQLIEKYGGNMNYFREKTGLPIASYFSATKIMCLLDSIDGLREDAENGKALFGTIDTWLIWKLTNGKVHVTDVTNASRTLLMNIKTLKWDEEICKELGIPMKMLPQIKPSSCLFGHVDTSSSSSTSSAHSSSTSTSEPSPSANHSGSSRSSSSVSSNSSSAAVPHKLEEPHISNKGDIAHYKRYHNVPIAGVLGDQNAALFGQICFNRGDAKCTYGTGAFLLMNTGNEIVHSKSGLLTTVAYQLGGGKGGGTDSKPVYALEGSIAYSGSVIQWLRDNLEMIKSAKETEEIADSIPDNGGVYFVPAFAGLYAPYWRDDARGIITGLTAYHTKAHIVRAALEASAFQTIEIAEAMIQDTSLPISELRIDGGLAKNDLFVQFQADMLNLPIVVPKVLETTALGAAYVAGLGTGLWSSLDDIQQLWHKDKEWTSKMPPDLRAKNVRFLCVCFAFFLHYSLLPLRFIIGRKQLLVHFTGAIIFVLIKMEKLLCPKDRSLTRLKLN
jgi:glycerol kinase